MKKRQQDSSTQHCIVQSLGMPALTCTGQFDLSKDSGRSVLQSGAFRAISGRSFRVEDVWSVWYGAAKMGEKSGGGA